MELGGSNGLLGAFMFQSSLEGNPEWNATLRADAESLMFQSSLEGNPEWNALKGEQKLLFEVSILTRGKPRVEPCRNPKHYFTPGFNPHSRETPSGTGCLIK